MTDLISPDALRARICYDPATGELSRVDGGAGCTPNGQGRYLGLSIDGRAYQAHIVIWAMMTGAYPESTVDHKNRNGHDNRWENLRQATLAQQQANRGLFKNNSSGLRGVYRKNTGWHAQVRHNGKTQSLGMFRTIEAAGVAVQAYRERIWGEFAS